MITRKEYLNGEATHDEYYLQFVTADIIDLVQERIGLDLITASTDPAFNDIPLERWERLYYPLMKDHIINLLTIAGDLNAKSYSNCACIAKRAASLIREASKP